VPAAACPDDVIEARIPNPDRKTWGKITEVSRYRALKAKGTFGFHHLPEPRIRIDTSQIGAAEAARRIDAILDG
jgi:hypothetical protein